MLEARLGNCKLSNWTVTAPLRFNVDRDISAFAHQRLTSDRRLSVLQIVTLQNANITGFRKHQPEGLAAYYCRWNSMTANHCSGSVQVCRRSN